MSLKFTMETTYWENYWESLCFSVTTLIQVSDFQEDKNCRPFCSSVIKKIFLLLVWRNQDISDVGFTFWSGATGWYGNQIRTSPLTVTLTSLLCSRSSSVPCVSERNVLNQNGAVWVMILIWHSKEMELQKNCVPTLLPTWIRPPKHFVFHFSPNGVPSVGFSCLRQNHC